MAMSALAFMFPTSRETLVGLVYSMSLTESSLVHALFRDVQLQGFRTLICKNRKTERFDFKNVGCHHTFTVYCTILPPVASNVDVNINQ